MTEGNGYTDHELFTLIAEGDETAFARLYKKYAVRLWPFLLRLTKTESATEEIIQEVFLRVWLHRDQLTEVDYPRAWIFRIAANQAHNWFNKKLLDQKTAAIHGSGTEQEDPSQESHFHLKSMLNAIHAAVQELPPQRRKIYQMNRDKGMKAAAIASELNISISTVKNTLAASLQFIRKRLEDQGFINYLLLCAASFTTSLG